MSLEGVNAAQSAMIQSLSSKSTDTQNTGLFGNILSSQLMESVSGTGTESDNTLSGIAGEDWTKLLLISLMCGSGSSVMLQSLSSAFSRSSSSYRTLTPAFSAASAAYGLTASNGTAITPVSASKPTTPAIRSNETNRSAALYRQVIDQFSVETNPRYAVNKKGHGDTYCNIFMWDVTSAMGAEIPHYINPETGAPMTYPNVKGARELSANGIYNWLGEHGSKYGWFQVTPEEAQALANQGRPVVTAFKKSPHGHVQVVCPSKDGLYDAKRGVTIAQAGRRLRSYTPITSIYNESLSKVVYYAHA